jgi:hypothetical protein
LSFFDEVDEPPTSPRPRRPSGTGGGRRPPTDQQAIAVRRAVAGGGVLVALIVIVLGVHSCQVSSRNSSLRDYTNNVSSLMQESDNTGSSFFGLLSGASSAGSATSLQNQINNASSSATSTLNKAQNLDVPDQVKTAQQNVLLALTMRRDGMSGIAKLVQNALGPSTSSDAINKIAAQMALFYASDAVYKDYAAPQIVGALHAAGITVGPSGESLDPGQFLPDLGWLTPSFIATKLGTGSSSTPSSSGPITPGTHGHSLNSVSVAGVTLQTGSTNAIPASPPPTFDLNYTNGGQNNETNVSLKVSVSGTSISGQATQPSTTAGQTYDTKVTLKSSPPPGPYTVTATVQPVPGEKNTANNTLSYEVTFQ